MSRSQRSKTIKSRDVIRYIGIVLGIAFFMLMGFSVAFVLLMYEGTYKIILSVIVFFLYTILFSMSFMAFSKKIKQAFSPLEENLERTRTENESLYRELEMKSSEVNEAYKRQEDLEFYYEGAEADYRQSMAKLMRYVDSVNDVIASERILCEDMNSEVDLIKSLRGQYINEADTVRDDIKLLDNRSKDISLDMVEINKAYKVLSDNLTNSVSLIENIFTEMGSVTSLCSQLELYSMNTSIEIARSGLHSLSVSNALDEIKRSAKKISEKNDAISLLIIQAKNSVSLALDQASYCEEMISQNNKDCDRNIISLGNVSEKVKNLTFVLDKLMESISVMSGYAYKTHSYIEKHVKYMGFIKNGLDEYMDEVEDNDDNK